MHTKPWTHMTITKNTPQLALTGDIWSDFVRIEKKQSKLQMIS